MGEIVNLRAVRKAKKRIDHAAQADANRLRHGRNKSAHAADAAERTRLDAALDGARRDDQ